MGSLPRRTLGTGTTTIRRGTATTRTTTTPCSWLGIDLTGLNVQQRFDVTIDDMYTAYVDCRRRKKNKPGAKKFEASAMYNIIKMTREINEMKYKLQPSSCFVVKYPVAREVFCASFRDRVVQHFVYNELNPVIEKMLINDTKSCRKGRGTDNAIKRVSTFLRRETDNYANSVHIAKLDLKGFFMNIDIDVLLDMVLDVIWNKYDGRYKNELDYLCRMIIKTDITQDATRICPLADWNLIPPEKSLFGREYGIAIGNITSQLFANLYLNEFDHFMKSRHKSYCRYVDDIVIVDKDKAKIEESIRLASSLLKKYHQRLNTRKTTIRKSDYGVTFLGIDIMPYYNKIGKKRINRMYYTSRKIRTRDGFIKSLSSRKGMFSRYKGYRLYYRFFDSIPPEKRVGVIPISNYRLNDVFKPKKKKLTKIVRGGICYV